ncbi:glycosyltransferase involved in cell wall biosynthesis [Flavobacterium sp. 7E]|uniref:glycosyltransferase family 2 protein n=1 Tax=Flavobacterium sp. 7E TaxID=2735898 RepID=UPI0015703C39|nr:glycosyltransferase [Flavobacterium sp. 7E]NRS89392.1 glycosyltransferase involved in cell wall biosynthesis [Flavobacterium sp. 7E]
MEVERPLISIIVPNYNHEKYLVQRLDSIFNQSYTNYEVILLDDCSTDSSRDILSEYAKNAKVAHCVFNNSNSGNTFKQWNKGIALAKGEYIWIAESDDFCEPNFLEEVIKPFMNNKEVVLSYCQSNRVNKDGVITGDWLAHTDDLDSNFFCDKFLVDGNFFVEKFLIFKNVIPNASALLIRKKALESVGDLRVDNELKYCGDWLLYFKVVLNNNIAFNSKKLNYFRYHSQSVIAKASQNEKRVSIIDIDFLMRSKMITYLKKQNVNNYNAILLNNNRVIKELKYEKVFLYQKNKEKVKALFTLLSIFNFFSKRFQLRKKVKLKFKKIVS